MKITMEHLSDLAARAFGDDAPTPEQLAASIATRQERFARYADTNGKRSVAQVQYEMWVKDAEIKSRYIQDEDEPEWKRRSAEKQIPESYRKAFGEALNLFAIDSL